MTPTAVELYAALWERCFFSDHYARKADTPGQQRLFGDEEPVEASKPLADLEGFKSRQHAQQFLDAEVGAPGAKVARRTKGWGIVIPSEEATGMIARHAATTSPQSRGFPPNHVIAEVRDMNGNKLGYEIEPHDGTEDGIRAANTRLRERLEDIHPTWSNIATRTGATNDQGHPAWAVSPNSRNVYATGTPEAMDLLNWTTEHTNRPKIGNG